MQKLSKKDIKGNFDYLKTWDDYQAAAITEERHKSLPLLMPISVDIVDGCIVRHRIKANIVQDIWKCHKGDLPKFLFDEKARWALPDPKEIFDNYIEAFPDDFAQSSLPPSPLDIVTKHPTWLLFHLPRKNWKFSKGRQYSVENDRDDLLRNFEKVCVLDGGNYLILSNRDRSKPENLKFNLHVNIHQKLNGEDLWTDIIIDPSTNNSGQGLGHGTGSN